MPKKKTRKRVFTFEQIFLDDGIKTTRESEYAISLGGERVGAIYKISKWSGSRFLIEGYDIQLNGGGLIQSDITLSPNKYFEVDRFGGVYSTSAKAFYAAKSWVKNFFKFYGNDADGYPLGTKDPWEEE